jgi:RNA polymerase I-specific transcription initiation factor RRN3
MSESSSAPLTRRVVYDRIHALLLHLLSLIPTLSSTLQPLLVRNFPHKRLPKSSQVTYIRNMLRITEYCPELADKLLATIIDRAIQIDVRPIRKSPSIELTSFPQVEIQVELEELEEAENAQQQQPELFEVDPFDTVVGQEGYADSDADTDGSEDGFSDISTGVESDNDDERQHKSAQLDVVHITDMASKLDAILKLLFDHFQASAGLPPNDDSPHPSDPAVPPALTPEEYHALLREQFQALLVIFHRTILRTYKSRYTQFLLFWFASRAPELADAFLGELVSTALLEPAQPALTRAAAASYLGSLVSRATFVERAGARAAMRVLCQFLRAQLDVLEGPNHRTAAPAAIFYAATQAVFLVFCFRWRDLLEDENEDYGADADADEFGAPGGVPAKKWMVELGVVQRAVASAMNPLMVRLLPFNLFSYIS